MRSFFVRQKLVKCNKRVPMIFLTLIDTPEIRENFRPL